MNLQAKKVWLGFSKLGEKVYLEPRDLKNGVAVLGRGSETIAALIAHSLNLSGEPVFLLDLSGRATRDLSGYVETFDSSYLMKDAFKLDEENQEYHGQLISSALSTILGLSRDQESILNLMANATTSSDEYASPSALYANAPSEGGRATDRQQVQAKLVSLRLLEATGELGRIAELAKRGAIICCSEARNPELGEAAAGYILAKLLVIQRRNTLPITLIINDAHRIFRAQRFLDHSRRLQNILLRGDFGKVVATEFNGEIDERVLSTCTTRILSSSAWNDADVEEQLLSGMFALKDLSSGSTIPFVPRPFQPRTGEVEFGPIVPAPPPELTINILEAVKTNDLATRESVISWLSIQNEHERAAFEIERLIKEQFIVPYHPEVGSTLTALKLTLLGEAELKRLKENG